MPYIGRSTEAFGVRSRFTYLASASDTSVSGPDVNGLTLSFTDGAYVDVFLNGVRLKHGTDYVTTTANTIGSLSALAANDEVEVVVFDVFSLADMVSSANGGNFSSQVNFNTDSAVVAFGADNDVTLTHVADTGLILKNTHTSGNSGIGAILTLQTGDTDIAVNNILGSIQFQAPDEGTGTDAILVAGKMEVFSEGDFSSSNNATSMRFLTGNSAAAGSDGGSMILGSTGNLTLKDLRTADGSSARITLQSGDTDIAQDDIIGQLEFQAPDEATGTDAILMAAAIGAVSEGDFSSSSNATKLSFKTGASEAATEKMSLSSAGLLTIADDFMIKDGGTIGVASTNDAITISSAGIVTFKDDIIIKDAGTIGSASDTDAISISSGGVVNISATTANTSASDGALTVAGGLGVALDASIGDDLRLISDGAILSFGADSEIQLIHVADDGLILKHTGTGDGKEPSLTFQAGDNDIAQDDILGSIFFQAPDEGAGTDAILVSAGIEAISEGDFSASSNATSLRFLTGSSAAASERMRIDSAGRVLIGTDSTTGAMFTITPTVQIEGTSFDTASMSIFKNSNDGEGAFFFIGKSKGTSVGSVTTLASGNDIGTIAFVGADGTDRQNIAASIVGKIASDVSPGSNDMPGTINFNTTSDGATASTVRMSLDQLGRLRMGSDGEPDHRLVSQQTTSVGTSAATIATVGIFATFGGHYFITGRNADATASRFCDQLTAGLNGSINVLHSTTVRGSPASRSYSLSSENLQVAMGSGSNYTINVFCIDQITS